MDGGLSGGVGERRGRPEEERDEEIYDKEIEIRLATFRKLVSPWWDSAAVDADCGHPDPTRLWNHTGPSLLFTVKDI